MVAIRAPRFDYPGRTNLPGQLTSFVGRGPETECVVGLLANSRLVTLTGAGGIGKTRLAVEVGRQSFDRFASGVWLMELGRLANPNHIPHAVLAALGLVAPPGRLSTESLIRLVGDDDVLFIFDNCEHLIGAVAEFATRLLIRCGGVRILATSRDVLRVDGEVTWRVPSMTMPPEGQPIGALMLQQCESARLFIERARAARPSIQITDNNAANVASICRRLDGIPLAIELAAARARSLSIADIDDQMTDQFHLLTGGPRVAMPRQRTLRASFDWSHDLLSQDEKRVFRRLSVFAGGVSLRGAKSVCAFDGAEPSENGVIEVLSRLVDKSLVIPQLDGHAAGRFHLLEPIRQYAKERLSAAEESDAVHARHARYFLDFGSEARDGLLGASQVLWMTRVVEELDNLRVCFGWALSHDPTEGLRLAIGLERFWFDNSPAEGSEWLSRALPLYERRDELRAHALVNAALWGRHRRQFDQARDLGRQGLEIALEVQSALYISRCLEALAEVERAERADGWVVRIRALLAQAEPHMGQTDDPDAWAIWMMIGASALEEDGDVPGAQANLEAALTSARERDDLFLIECLLLRLAEVNYTSGDREGAERLWSQVLSLARQRGSRTSAGHALEGLARIAVDERTGRYQELHSESTSLLKLAGIVDADDGGTGGGGLDSLQSHLGAGGSEVLPHDVEVSPATSGLFDVRAVQRLGSVRRLNPGRSATAEIPNEPTFVREGEFWSLTYEAVVTRIRDSKGIRVLAHLLAEPGRPCAAIDLERLGAPGSETIGRAVASGDAGEHLDVEARAAYRARVAELREAIEVAESWGKADEAGLLRDEVDFITHELSRALGLGGRSRRAGSVAERARLNVVRAVRSAMRRVAAADVELGAHLQATVHTGMVCVYTPDPRVPITWRVADGDARLR